MILHTDDKTTCHEKFQLGDLMVASGQLDCENRCTQNNACNFFFFGEDNLCLIYMYCEERRMVEVDGNTYKKEHRGIYK